MMFPYYTLNVTAELPDFSSSECLLCDETEDIVMVEIRELPHYRVCFCSECLAKLKIQSHSLMPKKIPMKVRQLQAPVD